MNQIRWFALILIPLLLAIPACQKKQSLVDKAFLGKNFEAVPKEEVEEEPDLEEDEEETGERKHVLVDSITEPQKESVFEKTQGIERPSELPFPKDPPAPVLNFEEAKLYDVVHIICELMGVNYIIDPSVKDQTITIGMVEGDQKLKTSELFDLILKLHNLTMVLDDKFVRIMPLDAPDVIPGLELLHGTTPNPNLMQEELVIQIIPLKFTSPEDISDVIKEFLSPSARILSEPINNLLILIDKYNFIAKAMELIPIFDVSVLENKKMVLYQFKHVDAVESAGELEEILSAYGFDSENDMINLFPLETLNALLVIANRSEVFKELDFWVEKMDREAQFEEVQVFVYEVENTTADAISSTLGQIFGYSTGMMGAGMQSSAASQRRTTSPNRNPQDQTNRTQQQRRTQQGQQTNIPDIPGAQAAANMVIDYENNALIFHTTPREYYRVRKVLRKLDVLPRQVFLEVTVLSISLEDSFNMGFSWGFEGGDIADEESTGGTSITRGFDYAATGASFQYSYVTLTKNITASISAAKSKGYANILQQPHIMAIDNKEASISIGTDLPIISSNINIPGSTGTGSNVITSNNVQYRKTGVDLTFTPFINANGIIRMKISLDISSPGSAIPAANSAPAIDTNTLGTELIVKDGQTIVMGGMISDNESWGKSFVPFLGRIPLVKHLFTDRNTSSKKTELIVLITPRLVESPEASMRISREFKDKILGEFEGFKLDRE